MYTLIVCMHIYIYTHTNINMYMEIKVQKLLMTKQNKQKRPQQAIAIMGLTCSRKELQKMKKIFKKSLKAFIKQQRVTYLRVRILEGR